MQTIETFDATPLLEEIANSIRESFTTDALKRLQIVGIHNGGVYAAELLAQLLDNPHPIGKLGISFYRDDFSRIGLHPKLYATTLPTSMADQEVLLVDDVLYSGRTVRAAMNALFDFGRPARLSLAVMVTRQPGRELPISADFCPRYLTLTAEQECRFNAKTMQLEIRHRHANNDLTSTEHPD